MSRERLCDASSRMSQGKCFADAVAARSRSGSTATLMPARSCCSSMTERESRSPQPRLSASVISANARLHIRIGMLSSRPSALARATSLCASRKANDGGSYLPGRNWSSSPLNVSRRPPAPWRTACAPASLRYSAAGKPRQGSRTQTTTSSLVVCDELDALGVMRRQACKGRHVARNVMERLTFHREDCHGCAPVD